MLSNKEVSSHFKLLSKLMEIHGENAFRAKSYANSSFQIGRLPKPLTQMSLDEMEAQQGIGKSVAPKISELLETGKMATLTEYLDKTPPGIVEMIRIKGLGGKKIATIWKELDCESVGELLYACYENRLAMLKGFGAKTQQSVIDNIEFMKANADKALYPSIEVEANLIIAAIQEITNEPAYITGAVRRKCPIIESIELVVGFEDERLEALMEAEFWTFEEEKAGKLIGRTVAGTPLTIYYTDESDLWSTLFSTTGFPYELEIQEDADSEVAIFEANKWPYILPELREKAHDEAFLKRVDNDNLIQVEDIKGIVHAHSTYSDGRNSLAEMAEACQEKGFEYLAISDHSKTAVYAGGLSIESVAKQQKEIDQLNFGYTDFRIFKGIESDILNDGSLDYPDEILSTFDFVIASVHANLRMDETKAMQRLLTAIQNPHTTILGHPTGRLLLSRNGYPIDHKTIIEACAEYNVSIELNANPHRLDIDWKWIPYAMEKGVKIGINPDAHSIDGINDVRYGVYAARKGGLTKEMTLNTMTAVEFESFISAK